MADYCSGRMVLLCHPHGLAQRVVDMATYDIVYLEHYVESGVLFGFKKDWNLLE